MLRAYNSAKIYFLFPLGLAWYYFPAFQNCMSGFIWKHNNLEMDILLIRASVSSYGSFLPSSILIYNRLTFADTARRLGTALSPFCLQNNIKSSQVMLPFWSPWIIARFCSLSVWFLAKVLIYIAQFLSYATEKLSHPEWVIMLSIEGIRHVT